MWDRDYHFLLLSARTGIRPSEALSIIPDDFRWDEGNVRVRTLKQKKDERTGKQKVIYRDVDLSDAFIDEFRPYSDEFGTKDRIFPFSRITAWRIFKETASAAGLSKTYTLYSLRHSRCIHLLEATDKDYRYVMGQMGHSDVNVTMSYVHVLPETRQEYRKRIK
jgi:integrase